MSILTCPYPRSILAAPSVCSQSVPSLSSFRSRSAPPFRPAFAPPIPDMPPRAGPLSEVGESSKRTRHDPRALYAIRPDNLRDFRDLEPVKKDVNISGHTIVNVLIINY